ncbi:vitamin B6 photo-protection and homoeostasis-domain-containing protein [Stachybotrys elegans]|uniref:Vitamin B6 photo-protection and homoeostasis-domain-containing protein n=1 Tax=Stachybotrys elegans TaxID=80388 RepID=A0A8K0SK74_9HYPO|nr:vitamin B6 photo-protection and homoeostasis-domain-containing protein [Stachybotrys elegans]
MESKPDDTAQHENMGELLGRGHDVVVSELDKSGNVKRRWLHTKDNCVLPIVENRRNDFLSRSLREWRKTLADAFLPVGFPHSVSADYLAYQTYDSLQAFFSTITSLLANRALLQGLGVGDANSSATHALLLTILKDAMSRIATIVFAHRFGLRIEPDAKRYRFLADLFNDTAFFLELLSPALGSWGKVAALSLGEALRALCGVAAGASKAALSVHFAKHDNLAELNAKEASQETAVGLVGLLVGTIVVKHVEDPRSVVALTVLLVLAHLGMNYLAVRSVCMTSLNRQRATILFEQYLTSGRMLTPTEVAAHESIIFWRPVINDESGEASASLHLSEDYARCFGKGVQADTQIIDTPTYVLFVCPQSGGLLTANGFLRTNAQPIDAIKAWHHLMLIAKRWTKGSPGPDKRSIAFEKSPEFDSVLRSSLERSGWDLDTQAFETGVPVRLDISKGGAGGAKIY